MNTLTTELVVAETLSTEDVKTLVGCSYRQLDYWCRVGLIPGQPTTGPGSGRRRVWTLDDIERARLTFLASRLSNMPLAKTVAMLEHELRLQRLAGEYAALEQPGAAA